MVKKRVRVIVLQTAGTNCDHETAWGFELAGARRVDLIHINELFRKRRSLLDYDILAIPGGFSYGDDISAGKLFANEFKYRLSDSTRRFLERDGMIIGVCNGFQVLVKAGLLPGFNGTDEEQLATLTFNDSGKFECRWVTLKVEQESFWTRELGRRIYLPVAHGEGKFVVKSGEVLKKLEANGQIILRYADEEGKDTNQYPANPNGSVHAIAGITNPQRTIFGLMPHPERHLLCYQHPQWRRKASEGKGDGYVIFKNVVEEVKKR